MADQWIDNAVQASGLAQGMAVGMQDQFGCFGAEVASVPVVGPSLPKPTAMTDLAVSGAKMVANDPILASAMSLLSVDSVQGFTIGTALMRFRVTKPEFLKVRELLGPTDKKGFDLAISLHIGRVVTKVHNLLHVADFGADPILPALLPRAPAVRAALPLVTLSKAKVGYLATTGMQGAAPAQKVELMETVAVDPAAREGAVQAVTEIASARKNFWHRLLTFIGLEK